MWYEITTHQMQYDTADKETDQKINAEYTLEGVILQNVDKIKYLEVTITEGLRWDTYVSNICTEANRTPGFLRRNSHPRPQEVNGVAYK